MSDRPHGAKIRVIIKFSHETIGHVTNISDTLENLQRTVEGPIECIQVGANAVLIVNEEGKLRDLPHSFFINEPFFHDEIVGTSILVGCDGSDEFCDLEMSRQEWKEILRDWGNVVD